MPLNELVSHVVAQAATNTGYFQRVGEAVVDEDAAREGEHLCLVLHAPKGGREDEAVVVALELGAVVTVTTVEVFLTKTLIGDKLKPVHCCGKV